MQYFVICNLTSSIEPAPSNHPRKAPFAISLTQISNPALLTRIHETLITGNKQQFRI